MNILIISHFFPPHFRVGARRPYYMARSLADLGHEVTLLTTLDPQDELSKWEVDLSGFDIIRVPKATRLEEAGSWDRVLFRAYHSTKGIPLIGKFVRGICSLSLPVHFHLLLQISGNERLAALRPDVIIASGGPWSIFESARALKEKLGGKLYLDYRDPWNVVLPGLDLQFVHNWGKWPLSAVRRSISRKRERSIGRAADGILSVSDNTVKNAKLASGCPNGHLIYNGFGSYPKGQAPNRNSKMNVVYTGRVYEEQTLDVFIAGLEQLERDRPEVFEKIDVQLVGVLDSDEKALGPYLNSPLRNMIKATHFIDQNACIDLQRGSDVLISLGLKNVRGIPGSKFFDYLSSMRPIVLVSTSDDGKETILNKTNTGFICTTSEELFSELVRLVTEWGSEQGIQYSGDRKEIDIYSFSHQMSLLSEILEQEVPETNCAF